ncbi:transcription antiterminator [Halobacillus sp. Marseille-Q1614]|uniref:BglG family transcription antiterminator n=1 Tax=Halobacillus sp. Marseille-Q1614 TaxID=2709134 RepID=UPI00156E36FD|nr:PTS sugar transporter subunit IIA [Halobacillus sp. Marseille-Q1614]
MSRRNSQLLPEKDESLNDIISKLTTQLQIMIMTDFSSDPILMEGLRIHLNSAIHRIRHKLAIRNPMLNEIKKMYPYMFRMVGLALEDVSREYELKIPEDEAAYLVLHFQAAVERLQKNREDRLKAIIVCELGVGMSHLLEAKLEQLYKGIEVIGCVGEREVHSTLETHSIDFVISTKNIENLSVPVVVVSPLLEAKDKRQLDQFLEKLRTVEQNNNNTQIFRSLLDEDLTVLRLKSEHRFKVIETLACKLEERGRVSEKFTHRSILRERSSSTAIGGGIAIPHAHPNEVKESAIAIAVLDKPLEWGTEKVSIIFLLAITNEDRALLRPLMKTITKISESPNEVEKILHAENFAQVKRLILQ